MAGKPTFLSRLCVMKPNLCVQSSTSGTGAGKLRGPPQSEDAEETRASLPLGTDSLT